MQKLPRLSGPELIKILSRAGFKAIGQRGSHVKLRKTTPSGRITTIVPKHREIDRGTLLEIMRECKLTREEFMRLAKRV